MRSIVLGVMVGAAAAVMMPVAASAQAQADVTVTGVSLDQAKSKLLGELINHGYSVTSDGPTLVTLDRRITDIAYALLYSTRAGGAPDARVSLTFLPQGQQLRIVGNIDLVSNPGTAFERREPLQSGDDVAGLQGMLESLRAPTPVNAAPTQRRVVKDGHLVMEDLPAN